MKLVLCDDNRILCDALAAALGARGHQVLAIATNPGDGIAAVTEHQPDGCLLDLRFPGGGDGLCVARAARKHCPGTRVLVLSALSDPAVWPEVLGAGVAGFVRKDQNVGQIADALDVIAAGGAVFDPVLARQAKRRTVRRRRTYPVDMLTTREHEVLRRMVAGESTTQMSREMQIAISTIRTYVQNVLTKLGAHSRLEAAALAIREDLLAENPAA